VLLTGLAPGTNYYYRVVARNVSHVIRSDAFGFSTGGDLIVDNPEAQYSGNWTLATSAADKYGAYYQYALTTNGGMPTAEATYVPAIAVAGQYDVAIWYPGGAGRSTNAPVTIFHNGGVTTFGVNQTTNGGVWRLLASALDYAAGTNNFAVVGNNTGETNTVVMADAMRWSYTLSQDNPPDGSVPPWWADFYFGGNVDGAADADGDGLSNYSEFVCGTDPTDGGSRFTVSASAGGSGMQIRFAPWQGGRSYQLATTSNLNSSAWALLPDVPMVGGLDGAFTVTNLSAGGPQFYRVAVRFAP
jgi:hypothetical protein